MKYMAWTYQKYCFILSLRYVPVESSRNYRPPTNETVDIWENMNYSPEQNPFISAFIMNIPGQSDRLSLYKVSQGLWVSFWSLKNYVSEKTCRTQTSLRHLFSISQSHRNTSKILDCFWDKKKIFILKINAIWTHMDGWIS